MACCAARTKGPPTAAAASSSRWSGWANNWVLHEDGDIAATGKNNDLFMCLPDGADADSLSDGCVRMATLNDLPTHDPAAANHGEGAEWTGGFFDPTGTHFFVSVQHNMTGFGVILDITGFRTLHD